MTLVGVFGVLVSLLAWRFAVIVPTRLRVTIFAAALLAHLTCTVLYYGYVQTNAADTAMYYYDSYYMYPDGFGFSTQFIIWLVQSLKWAVGGTYLDYFFLFQAVGFFGIAFLMRTIEEVYASLSLQQPLWSYFLILLPGLHFWTSAIGKDALLFFACCLAIWAAMQIRRRYISLGIATLVMILVRPHIAIVALAAITLSLFADRTVQPVLRGALAIGSLGAIGFAIATVGSTFGIDLTNADSVSNYLSARDVVTMSDDLGGSGLAGAAYPVKLLSFLFRPLFVDATELFGYVASFENLALLVIFALMLLRMKTFFRAFQTVPFVRYALIASGGITLALAGDYYNVGLGLRQKTMVLPGFLIAFITVQALRTARREAGTVQPLRAEPLRT